MDETALLERDVERLKGGGEAIAVDPSSAALYLALDALDLEPGDEVITSALSSVQTIGAIIRAGGTPILADVTPSMTLGPAAARERTTRRTRAIIPVHLGGHPCMMEDLVELANERGVKLVESSPHAIEAAYLGRQVGTFGDIGYFSLSSCPTLAVDGGILLVRELELARRIRLACEPSHPDLVEYRATGSKPCATESDALGYRMTPARAKTARRRLADLEVARLKQRRLWERYDEAFADLPITRLPIARTAQHGFGLYTIQIDEDELGLTRDEFLQRLSEHGIGGAAHRCVAEHAYYRRIFGWRPDDYPTGARLGRSCAAIPLSPALSDDDVSAVVAAVRSVVSTVARSVAVGRQQTSQETASSRRRVGMTTAGYQFLIAAPAFKHTSAGIRVLHRLCHLLNEAGYRAAISPFAGTDPAVATNPMWNTPTFLGRTPTDAVVVYPEVVHGNPLGASRVVRWLLNYPGVIGGDSTYADDEMLFAWDRRMLERINLSLRRQILEEYVLKIGAIDPEFIYPDALKNKDVDCYFIYKGRQVRERFRIPSEHQMICLDDSTPSYEHLGRLLRRTRNLYTYDHASMVVHEAIISGCTVWQVHEDGRVVDPRECTADNLPCSGQETNSWPEDDFIDTYKRFWLDPAPATNFAKLVGQRWTL